MKLYTQCALPYEGYVTGCLDLTDGAWQLCPPGKLPEHVSRLLTRSGTKFFLGTLESRRCLCVRGIPDAQRDENGRACFIHLMLDAPEEQRGRVDRLAALALADPQGFAHAAQAMLLRQGSTYRPDGAALMALTAQDDNWKLPGSPDDTLILPESSLEHFIRETGLEPDMSQVHLLGGLPEMNAEPMSLYFYCSAPADGYTFTRADSLTGATVSQRDEAAAALPEQLFRMITTSGADMALMKTDGQWCFFVKGIPTRESGLLTLATVGSDETLLRRTAAWAAVHPEEMQSLAAACIVPRPAEGEYAVVPEKAAALARRMRTAPEPAEPTARRTWRAICQPSVRDRAFALLKPAPDLETMNRMLRMNVTPGDVVLLLPNDADDAPDADDGRIDLMKLRWFRPAAVTAGIAAATGLIWLLIQLIH